MLEDHNFEWCLRVDQKNAGIDRFGSERPGICLGYAQYWERNWLFMEPSILADKFPDNVPFLDEIIRLNGRGYINRKFKEAKSSQNLLDIIVEKEIAEHMSPKRMLLISLADHHWSKFVHHIRIYCDENSHLHLFDANCGWFKSTEPNPSLSEIKMFLTGLFAIIDYKFRAYVKERHYEVDARTHLPKPLTVMFDKVAEERLILEFETEPDKKSKGSKDKGIVAKTCHNKPI